MPSTSMRLDNHCASIDKKSFYLYNTFCFIVLPILIYLLLSFILYSIHPKLRNVLSPSLPKHSINQNLAALVLTGLVLSIYVLICDTLSLFYSLGKHELRILQDYEDAHVQTFATAAVIIVSVLDFIALVVSLSNIILLYFLQSEGCREKHLLRCFFVACLMCACKFNANIYELISQDSEDPSNQDVIEGGTTNPFSQEDLEQVNFLQRQVRWLLQSREERHQSRQANSWTEQWENELNQQEDQINQWKVSPLLQKYSLSDGQSTRKMVKELNKWKTCLSDTEPELKREKLLYQRQEKLNKEQNELGKKQMLTENKAWLLLISFIAPFVCIGTHGGFVVMAWASDPGEASSLAVVFTLSFFYYFFGFRQLYIRISSIPRFKLKNARTKNESFRDVTTEIENYHNKLGEINLSALLCELLFIPLFMGIQTLIVFSYYYLPGPISSVPYNVMNLLQLVLFFGTGLITYKLFTFSAPVEQIILDGFMRAFRSHGSPSGDTAGAVGGALANALRKCNSSIEMKSPVNNSK